MGKIVLVTGGTRSGKSSFAEKYFRGSNDVLYIATAKVVDREMEERVRKHRETRNPNWDTYEGYKGLKEAVEKLNKDKIILECAGTMVTNLIFDKYSDVEKITREEIKELEEEIILEFMELVKAVKSSDKKLIIVTNEVGWGLVSEYRLGRIFADILGRVNQVLGQLSDEVYFTACGIPLKLK
ncbi:bifunctional adenosylcobinamide kinase/adenosylcobinamide-phosphate guanylyltransferase [Clostridium polynesiense]|uniref:bifunctional adenosylcobinamide kinase/adenosylcobinamide-phosphate guanylyltransferase n=1 Tax=Clostridium polynesiense TaxID=1325933 RepID=UPI00058DC51B|nr:bifunctional adenosylcobinamide kinase/adenosylcobinamide-phosphate guanylyltransferase [Clostridium polynesiense]